MSANKANVIATPMATAHSPWQGLWAGVQSTAPLLLGVVPFGLIYGVVVNSAHLSGMLGQAMSSIIFAGSAQLITARLFGESAPLLVIIATAAILNLRHVLYSASMAAYLRTAPARWRWLLAYLLTDESYAVVIRHFEEQPQMSMAQRCWYGLGVGMTLWVTWHLSTAAGIFLGTQIPASWGLDFSVPLTFIALVVPALRDRIGLLVALSAGLAALLLVNLPLKLGMLTAILVGIIVGYWLDRK